MQALRLTTSAAYITSEFLLAVRMQPGNHDKGNH